MTGKFPMRAYTKKELALMYFPTANAPHTAVNHLMSWIRRCQPLHQQLHQRGYTPSAKFFTAAQVEIIITHLGPPG